MHGSRNNYYATNQLEAVSFISRLQMKKEMNKYFGFSHREMSSMDVAKLLVLASEAMRCINPTKSKHLILKAIHANPLCREAWAAKQLLC